MTSESLSELDEMKRAWRALDRRLEREHSLALARFKHDRMRGVRGALRPLVAGQLAQAALGALTFVWSAMFWVEHRATPHLVALGALGQLYAIALTAFAVVELVAISRIDYAAPVLTIQKRIAELRARRIRLAPFFVVTGCVMWLPVTLVVFNQLGGAERWADRPELVDWFVWAAQPGVLAWLLANLVIVPTLALLLLRWLRDPQRAWLAKRVDDELAGRSVLRAESMLAEIAEFERE
jgi:uncharacterized membrane protein YhaH (DUF805 family)